MPAARPTVLPGTIASACCRNWQWRLLRFESARRSGSLLIRCATLPMKTPTIFVAVSLLLVSAARSDDAVFSVLNFGAKADGQTKCTDAIGKAIDAAAEKGGGTVYFPAG